MRLFEFLNFNYVSEQFKWSRDFVNASAALQDRTSLNMISNEFLYTVSKFAFSDISKFDKT